MTGSDSEATAENPTEPTEPTDQSGEGGQNGGTAPKISARLYEMEVTVSGGDGNSLADVGDRFDDTWERVLETYREEREADDTRPFQ